MRKTLAICLSLITLGFTGCATAILSDTLPNETSTTQTVTLQTDQVIALGQAVQNQTEQGLVFIGQDFNYLMTDGSTQLLNILKALPAEQRTLVNPTPLVLKMDNPSHFRGVLQIRYNTPIVDLDQKQKNLLTSLGFNQNFDLLQGQHSTAYPTTKIYFKGQLYQGQQNKKIQQTLPQPYPVVLQQQISTTTKHPVKRAARMALFPLAAAFDVVTIGPLLIWSDLRGDFNK